LGLAFVAAVLAFVLLGTNIGHYTSWPYWRQLDTHKPFHELTAREGVPALLGLSLVLYYLVDERRRAVPIAAIALALLAWHIGLSLPGTGGEPVHENVPKTSVHHAQGPITIDGRVDEAEWAGATVLTLGSFLPDADEDDKKHLKTAFGSIDEAKTKVRLLWDERALYVAFECQTKDAWTRVLERDGLRLNLGDPETPAVTVCLDPDAAERTYFRFDVTPGNSVRDLYAYLPELPQWSPAPTSLDRVELLGWDAKHLATAVSVQGELETAATPEEADKPRAKPASEGYSVELAIPWRDLVGNALTTGPDGLPSVLPGARLRANFCRVEPFRPVHWDTLSANLSWSTRVYDRPSFFGEIVLEK
jgi:hypothetical protein